MKMVCYNKCARSYHQKYYNHPQKYINDFLNSSGGWLVLNLHGLDSEGWGPISSKYLDKLLLRLLKIHYLSIKTMGEILV